MVSSKEWDWEKEKGGYWLEPCEELNDDYQKPKQI